MLENIIYDPQSATKENVDVTIVVNEEVDKPSGWKLSQGTGEFAGKWLLTKTYKNNTEEDITITDTSDNKLIGEGVTDGKVHVSVKNIDREGPKPENIECGTLSNDKVQVTITLNETVSQAYNNWNIVVPSPNPIVNVIRKTLDADSAEIIEVEDSAGNVSKLKVDVANQTVKEVPVIEKIENNSKVTNQNVWVRIVVNKKIKQPDGWTLTEGTGDDEGKWILKKLYTKTTDENIVIEDEEGNKGVNDVIDDGIIPIDIVIDKEGIAIEEISTNETTGEIRIKFNKTIYEITSESSYWYIDRSTGEVVNNHIFTESTIEEITVKDGASNTETVKIKIEYDADTHTYNVREDGDILTGIKIVETPDTTVYFQGEYLDTEGLKVGLIYNYDYDNPVVINEGFQVSKLYETSYGQIYFFEPGRETIVVKYEDEATFFYVTVKEVIPEKLIVNSDNVKKTYISGESLNTDGLDVKVKYNNGNIMDAQYTCEPQIITATTDKVTISYRDGMLVATYDIDVTERKYIITNYPNKLEYKQGDTLNLTGLKVMLKEEESSTDVTSKCTATPTALNEVGEKTITVKYEDGTIVGTFIVNVEKYITGIQINESLSNIKKNYIQGQRLDTNGIVLKVTYSDGSSENITEGFNVSNILLNDVGTKNIVVRYGGKETSYDVTVEEKKVTNLEFIETTKNSYYKGNSLDISSIALKITYNDGQVININQDNYDQYDITYSPRILNNIGNETITVTYEEKSTSFNVTVIDVTVEELNLNKNPNRIKYYVGESPYFDGMELQAIYNNGETENITDGFTYSPETFTTTGAQNVTITYGEKEVSFEVSVVEGALENLEIDTMPSTTEYYVGNALDLNGLKLKATYSDGTERIVELDEIEYERKILDTIGEQTITVNYEGKSVSFNVIVKEVEKSEVIGVYNIKDEYYKGDTLNTQELKVMVRNVNGDIYELENVEYSPMKLDTVGEQEITVTYKGEEIYKFNVNVVEKVTPEQPIVEKVEITKMPTKTNYIVGDKLDLTGLILMVKYNDGTSKEVKGEEIEIGEYILKTAGNKKIKFDYEGQKIEFNVAVKQAEEDNKDDKQDENKDNNKDDNKDDNKDESKDDNNGNNGDKQDSKNENNKNENNNNENDTDINKEENSNKNNKDANTANSRLPQTGIPQIIAGVLIVCALVSGALFIKYRKM